MSYNCKIEEKSDQPVLSIRTRRTVQDLPNVLGRCFGAVAQYLGKLGEAPAGAPFAAYYNMDMQDLDIEIGLPVSRHLDGKGEIQSEVIPARKMATCLYIGPYKEIEPAYIALQEFMAENKFEATGVAYEFYMNDPGETPEEELQTQIVFPLR